MGGTNNPSDDQLELVTSRIIDLAQALYPYVALDDNSYFDEAGFDAEMLSALTARIMEYIGSADGVEVSLEDHPQPRRLARYLLENVEYDVLEPPLAAHLLKEEPSVPKPHTGGSMSINRCFGLQPMHIIAIIVFLALLIAFVFVGLPLLNSETNAKGHHDGAMLETHSGRHHGGRGKGGGNFRNGSL